MMDGEGVHLETTTTTTTTTYDYVVDNIPLHSSRQQSQVQAPLQTQTIPGLIALLKRIRLNDPTLQHIEIEWKKLPPAYLNIFFSVLAINKTVTHVNLTKCNITDEVVEAIVYFIRTNRVVLDLNLSKNHLTDVAITDIAAALQMQLPSKTTTTTTTTTHHHRLVGTSNNCIRRLVLEGNAFTEHGIQVLCDAIPNTNIEVLKIGKMKIGHVGAQHIANMLLTTTGKLRKLDLRSCQLGSNGASIVFQALTKNETLEVLCLGKNNIDDAAIQPYLVEALRSNVTLRTLDIQYNPITNVGGKAIAQCLDDNNYTLRKLKLRHCNDISNDVKETLLDILLINSYGPELAFKTKDALRCILSQEESSNSSDTSGTITEVTQTTDNNYLSACKQQDEMSNPMASTTRQVQPVVVENSEGCVICYDNDALQPHCILLPCKHRNCCSNCAQRIRSCHMCREVIVKVFHPPLMIDIGNRAVGKVNYQ